MGNILVHCAYWTGLCTRQAYWGISSLKAAACFSNRLLRPTSTFATRPTLSLGATYFTMQYLRFLSAFLTLVAVASASPIVEAREGEQIQHRFKSLLTCVKQN